ncbi:MAG: PQQ-dependent sugar dehydrogenase [bacterium]
MPSRQSAVAVVFAIFAGMASGPTTVHAQTLPTGFALESVIGPPFGGEPISFTFLPDGRTLLIEKETGNVRLAAVGRNTSVVIYTVPNVSTQIERGLLGVAVDPNWPTRPYIYLSYTRTDSLSILALYRASGDLTTPTSTNLTLGSPYIVVETPDVNPYHNAGTIRFGNDGRLYLTWGDDGIPCQAQDLTVLNGKMLRLDVSRIPRSGGGPPSKGFITPPDNPFVGNPNLNARLVYAWGLRNPFRFAFDRLTGVLYIGEVGEEAYEEIDRIAPGGGGPNFGWPILEGPAPAGLGLTCGQSNTFTAPMYWYAHDPILDVAVIGGPLYRSVPSSPISFPASYDGSYFLLDWGLQWMKRLVLVGGVWQVAPPVPGQPSADHWAEGFHFYTDLQEGPDGALYLANQSPGGLYRIKHTSAGLAAPLPTAPVASFDVRARPNPSTAGQGVEFSWSAPRAGRVEVTVFDAAGREVARLSGAEDDQSHGVLTWSGRDAHGVAVPAGVYFYRVRGSDGASAAGRVTLLR